MATLVVNPSRAGGVENIDANWNNAWSETTGNSGFEDPSSTMGLAWQYAGGVYRLSRIVMVFNTIALNGGLVTAATLSVNVQTGFTAPAGTDHYVALTTHTTTNFTDLLDTDFNKALFVTEVGTARADCTTNGTKTFTLNATGIAWINNVGYTAFGLRKVGDINGTTPTIQDSSTPRFDGDTAASNKPTLTITYTPKTKIYAVVIN
jgi:hypothetical protein